MWQVVDDGFGSSRDISNISGIDVTKDQQVTMKREQYA